MPPIANDVFNHVAISVPNAAEAAAWYEKIFGLRRIRTDVDLERDKTPDAAIFKIYGGELKRVRQIWLTFGNGTGLEIFEFIDPPFQAGAKPFDYTRGGFFHVGITVADPKETARRACEQGATQIGETVDRFGETVLYLQDPWGSIVECLSCSFERLLANR